MFSPAARCDLLLRPAPSHAGMPCRGRGARRTSVHKELPSTAYQDTRCCCDQGYRIFDGLTRWATATTLSIERPTTDEGTLVDVIRLSCLPTMRGAQFILKANTAAVTQWGKHYSIALTQSIPPPSACSD